MARMLAAVVVLLVGLTACSGGSDDERDAAPSACPSPVAASVRATTAPSAKAAPGKEKTPAKTGAHLGGKFCTFLAKEQKRLAGLDRFAALTRLNLDLGATAGSAVDGKSLQAQARACPGPAAAVLRMTGLKSFSAL